MQTHALTTVPPDIERVQSRGLVIGLAGLALGAIGALIRPGQFLPSWLIGFTLCLGLSLGSLAMLMMQHMTGGQWGLVTRRIFEAASRLLPYCALLFVPIVVMLPSLFLWARPEAVRADEILQFKHAYLNVPFFLVRLVVYFLAWVGCAYFLTKWSDEQDRGEVGTTEADTRRFRVISGPGLVVYVILMSLAAIDWLMSLDPHWYSTIFGFIIIAGQALASLSFAVAILAILAQREPMASIVRTSNFHDLGKLMLAFVMLWTYFTFSQFLIIWSGNLAEEVPFYVERLQGGWQYVSVLILLGHFALPFTLLLSRDLKRRPNLLARVAWFIVAMRLVDVIWLVAPIFNHDGLPVSLANIAIPIGLVGIWVYLFAGQLRRRPLVPINDPYFKEMLAHGQHAGH